MAISGTGSCDTFNKDQHLWTFGNYKRCNLGHLSISCKCWPFLQAQNNLMPIRYAYSDIKKITNNFRDKLDEGAFDTVFKGKFRSGHLVAVKILGKSKATGQEFKYEVATSGRINHVNVVELIVFCFEGPKRALVYKFMPNGSLEKYIFRKEGTEEEIISLSWEKYEISLKVASGIDYLHGGCDIQILHFDIKPHNILLDKNFNPVISDFGLAKSYATDDSIVTLTAPRGTIGYMAPEMFYKNIGRISYKADVYSFGMLLTEMAGRSKNLNPFVDHIGQIHFPSWVYEQYSEEKEPEIEDATEEERKLVKKMITVALWCIQMKPSERPSMNRVIEMLEGDIDHLVMPPKPFLYPPEEDPAKGNNSTHSSLNLLPAEE
ncbi:rust resistance kinase Lr10-like [Apium graveolens]|uniref:rust resistance kinase Lr10-like n=1 Tax=Apium graveolens TaxID=4045 RepID=UPI003D79BE0F